VSRHRTLIHERVEQAQNGENPTVICRLGSGWAVLGDEQYLAGYSLLLPDPVVDHLTDLSDPARNEYLGDMALVGEALHACTDAIRINYEILGNGDAALHAHVFPRYQSEPDVYRRAPVWAYTSRQRSSMRFDPAIHGDLQRSLRTYLNQRRIDNRQTYLQQRGAGALQAEADHPEPGRLGRS